MNSIDEYQILSKPEWHDGFYSMLSLLQLEIVDVKYMSINLKDDFDSIVITHRSEIFKILTKENQKEISDFLKVRLSKEVYEVVSIYLFSRFNQIEKDPPPLSFEKNTRFLFLVSKLELFKLDNSNNVQIRF